jgi:hypothetical protein
MNWIFHGIIIRLIKWFWLKMWQMSNWLKMISTLLDWLYEITLMYEISNVVKNQGLEHILFVTLSNLLRKISISGNILTNENISIHYEWKRNAVESIILSKVFTFPHQTFGFHLFFWIVIQHFDEIPVYISRVSFSFSFAFSFSFSPLMINKKDDVYDMYMSMTICSTSPSQLHNLFTQSTDCCMNLHTNPIHSITSEYLCHQTIIHLMMISHSSAVFSFGCGITTFANPKVFEFALWLHWISNYT